MADSDPVLSQPSPSSSVIPFNKLKDCRHGRMLYNVNDRYVGRSLDLYGEFSELEVDIFRELVEPGDFVLDVGANIGAHTIFFAARAGPFGGVLAFEPQRLIFQTLCANIALNSLTNVFCYQIALGDAPGAIHVQALDPYASNNFGGLAMGGAGIGEDVPLIRLDSLTPHRCDLIKVDVEGMERAVLVGATGLIERFRPILYVENDRAESQAALIRQVDAMGYKAYWHHPPLFNPANFFRNPENVFGQIVSINMCCLPKESNVKVHGAEPIPVPPM